MCIFGRGRRSRQSSSVRERLYDEEIMSKTAITVLAALSLWALVNADSRAPDGTFLQVVDGTLVKDVDDSTVYVVDRDVLRPVTWAAFRKLYADFRGVATVVAIPRHLVHEPLGDGTRLVKTKDDPAVWLVDNGRTKRHVVSFRRRGFVWPKVKIVKPEEIDFLPVGPRLE